MAASIGGQGVYERKYSQPPETGTATTAAPANWIGMGAYLREPFLTRVVNGANVYQCRQGGMAALMGGPTGTGDDIADGTCRWTYISSAYNNNTIAGSQVLISTARGVQSTASPVAPSDNDGGSYTAVQLHAYASYPDSVAAVYRRTTASNAKTGFAASANWGGTSPGSGTGDELDVAWLELRGVQPGAPHASSHVERANSTGNVVTSATVSITVPCVLVAYWFGNGAVITPGTMHIAIPLGGFTIVPGATCLMSLSNDGYIQQAAAWRVENTPGTYSAQWTTANSEGAQLVLIAYALSEVAAAGTAATSVTLTGVSGARAASAGTAVAALTASATTVTAAQSSGTAAASATMTGVGSARSGAAGTAAAALSLTGTSSTGTPASGTVTTSVTMTASTGALAAAAGTALASITAAGASGELAASSGTAPFYLSLVGASSVGVAAAGSAAMSLSLSGITGAPTQSTGVASISMALAGVSGATLQSAGTAPFVLAASGIGGMANESQSAGVASFSLSLAGVAGLAAVSVGTATLTITMRDPRASRGSSRDFSGKGRIAMGSTLVAGDLEPDLILQCLEESGINGGVRAMNLVDVSSVALRIRRPDQSVVLRSATIEDAAQGLVRYVWTVDDTAQTGQHRGQVVITWANGENQTVPSDGSTYIWQINPAL